VGGRLCVVLGWFWIVKGGGTYIRALFRCWDVKERLSVKGREIRKEEKKRSG
jgi:hypothetical protein